jgi:Glycosyltransferase family 87
MTAPEQTSKPNRGFALGIAVWLLPLLVVGVMVARDPARRSVTPVFHLAAERWWAGGNLYADVRGYHYLPQFALLFAPFHAMPAPAGDLLWRVLSVALVLGGISALVRGLLPADAARGFFWACLLALAPCLGAVRNGQTNLAFGGLCLLAAAALSQERWNRAAALLVALVAVKPLGLVLVLLAPWRYRRLILPLAAGLAVLAAVPFAFAPASYALGQYRAAAAHLLGWSDTTESRFADLTALLRMAGFGLSRGAALLVRALAAAATLALWLRSSRREPEPGRALILILLATTYLLLFNPMTEKNSYAIAAPAYAVAAAALLSRPASRPWGGALAFLLVSEGILPELLWRVSRDFGLWWDPLTAVFVAAGLAWAIGRGRPIFGAAASRGPA